MLRSLSIALAFVAVFGSTYAHARRPPSETRECTIRCILVGGTVEGCTWACSY